MRSPKNFKYRFFIFSVSVVFAALIDLLSSSIYLTALTSRPVALSDSNSKQTALMAA
jgi:hypothetical protein